MPLSELRFHFLMPELFLIPLDFPAHQKSVREPGLAPVWVLQ